MADMNGFDANQHEPSRDFEPIPEGEYNMVVVASEVKECKGGNQFVFELDILDGQYKGRKVWDRHLRNHTSQKAQEIGRSKTADLCRAVGNLKPRDTIELHGVPVRVKIGLEKRDDKPGSFSSVVKKYISRDSAKPGAVAQSPTAEPNPFAN